MAHIDKQQLKHDPVAESIVHGIAALKARMHVLGPAALIVAIIVIAAIWIVNHRQNLPADGSLALVESQRDIAKLEQVARVYSGTFAGPAALAQLGYLEFARTNYSKALGYYRQLVDNHPSSFLVPAAQLAICKCHIAMGQYDDAANILKRDVLYNADTYAALQGQLDLVRVLMIQKKYDEAWQEMQEWDQQTANMSFSNLGDGLREQLLRETGMGTNMVVQAETPTSIQ